MDDLNGLSQQEVERRALLWTKLAAMLGLTTEMVAAAPTPRNEAERQASLYADIVARLPGREEDYIVTYPVSVRHPDLHQLSAKAMNLRTSDWPRMLNRIPVVDHVNWYGNLVRKFAGGDEGNGMYATEAMARAWPYKVAEDSVLGPS